MARRRINWKQYAKAGPVTVTRADGTQEVQAPLKPGEVRERVRVGNVSWSEAKKKAQDDWNREYQPVRVTEKNK